MSHHFDYANETAMMVGAEKPGIGGEALLGQKYKARNTVFPKGDGSNLPSWVAFDRQVRKLCYSFKSIKSKPLKSTRQSTLIKLKPCTFFFIVSLTKV